MRSVLGWDEKNLEDIIDEDIPKDAIPCSEVDFETFDLIKKYFEWNHLESDENKKKEWFDEFLNINDEILFKLIMASNYLELKDLLDETCKKVAEYIKLCKTPQEIRRRFNIKNDFTPEEEEAIKKENSWCDEN